MGFSLSDLTTESEKKGRTIVIHGTGGVGKSTVAVDACKANNGIMVLGENGISEMSTDVTRTPLIETWDLFQEVLTVLAKEKHDHKVIAIDTLDAMIPLLDTYVVNKYYDGDDGKANAYKAKYSEMNKEMCKVLTVLEAIKSKGIDVIIIVHSIVDNYRSPDSEVYQRWSLNLPGGAKTSLASLVFDYSDYCFFARRDVVVSDGKGKGTTRVLMTQWNASWDAKTRRDMPEKMLLNWSSIDKELN